MSRRRLRRRPLQCRRDTWSAISLFRDVLRQHVQTAVPSVAMHVDRLLGREALMRQCEFRFSQQVPEFDRDESTSHLSFVSAHRFFPIPRCTPVSKAGFFFKNTADGVRFPCGISHSDPLAPAHAQVHFDELRLELVGRAEPLLHLFSGRSRRQRFSGGRIQGPVQLQLKVLALRLGGMGLSLGSLVCFRKSAKLSRFFPEHPVLRDPLGGFFQRAS